MIKEHLQIKVANRIILQFMYLMKYQKQNQLEYQSVMLELEFQK
ncbi:unnamed protein product [Paramecium sonneborni]|uniref:Uncharacterized protein n=1 Tax=Paramecium sonneborni TaxID=65129 RepID=A0A8S1KJ46_9CILI|nr:unnamed protein product [Paramecium sonneborni]